MSSTTTAEQLVTALLGLPAQLDRIEEAATTRRPVNVHLITHQPDTAAEYTLQPTSWDIVDAGGAIIGDIRQDYRGWTSYWGEKNADDELIQHWHRNVSSQREAIRRVIERIPAGE